MDHFIKNIVSLLKEKIDLPEDEIKRLIEIPPDPKMGDYAFPCYSLSKTLKKSPNVIATELSNAIHTVLPIAEIKAIGPYVNFFCG